MIRPLIYPAGTTEAVEFAAAKLGSLGYSLIDHPSPEITHLLLDVPSFQKDGRFRGGGDVHQMLAMLPADLTVVGGNLSHPALDGYRKMDLLQDPYYLARNAAITADCALKVAAPLLKTTFADTPTLILGWGRIGKCLAKLLKALDCPVTVAARKETDLALLTALGYDCVYLARTSSQLNRFQLLFNTIPVPTIGASDLAEHSNCIKIELASQNGLEGPDVVIARGLPGSYAPESSGDLIARSFIRLYKEEET